MKTKLLLLLPFTLIININAQIGFQENIITDTPSLASHPISAFSFDIDGDGDLDVVSASRFDDKIAWYENTDGLGNFGTQQIITLTARLVGSLHASDIDGDNDIDIISRSSHKVAWYENIDGLGSFNEHIITTNTGQSGRAFSIDIDNDGDNDIISISYSPSGTGGQDFDNKLVWFENLNGLGSFSSENIISTDIIRGLSIHAVDIDGDNDIDIISASAMDDKIAWYENTDGLGNFGMQQIITTSEAGPLSVYAADLDGDNDMDILISSYTNSKISWYENTDGLGSFNLKQVIPNVGTNPRSVYAIDLDGDSDLDVLSASYDRVTWYENTDGLGTYGTQQIITSNVINCHSVYAGDIDNDGKIDVISPSANDDKIAWYKNLGANLSINDYSQSNFIIYPNPVNDILNIDFKTSISSILIYDSLGKLVLENYNKNSIDLSSLIQGLYFIKVIDINKNSEIKKIFKD